MDVYGLTGGIGSGKSTVADLLEEYGVPVVSADELSRIVVSKGSEGLRDVVARFGDVVVDEHGELDRHRLASIVFQDPARRRELEAILHPRIRARFEQVLDALEKAGHEVAVYEVPLLFEKNLQGDMKAVVLVTSPQDVRVARVRARDDMTETEVRARIAAQMDESIKRKRADYVIENDGTRDDLRREVEFMLARFLRIDSPRRPADPSTTSLRQTDVPTGPPTGAPAPPGSTEPPVPPAAARGQTVIARAPSASRTEVPTSAPPPRPPAHAITKPLNDGVTPPGGAPLPVAPGQGPPPPMPTGVRTRRETVATPTTPMPGPAPAYASIPATHTSSPKAPVVPQAAAFPEPANDPDRPNHPQTDATRATVVSGGVPAPSIDTTVPAPGVSTPMPPPPSNPPRSQAIGIPRVPMPTSGSNPIPVPRVPDAHAAPKPTPPAAVDRKPRARMNTVIPDRNSAFEARTQAVAPVPAAVAPPRSVPPPAPSAPPPSKRDPAPPRPSRAPKKGLTVRVAALGSPVNPAPSDPEDELEIEIDDVAEQDPLTTTQVAPATIPTPPKKG